MNPYLANALSGAGSNVLDFYKEQSRYQDQQSRQNENAEMRNQEMQMRQQQFEAQQRQNMMQEYQQAEQLIRQEAARAVMQGTANDANGLEKHLENRFSNMPLYDGFKDQVTNFTTGLQNEQSFGNFKNQVYQTNFQKLMEQSKHLPPEERNFFLKQNLNENQYAKGFIELSNNNLAQSNQREFLSDRQTEALLSQAWTSSETMEDTIEKMKGLYKSKYGEDADIDDKSLAMFYEQGLGQARMKMKENAQQTAIKLSADRSELFDEKLDAQRDKAKDVAGTIENANVKAAVGSLISNNLFSGSGADQLAQVASMNQDKIGDMSIPEIQQYLFQATGVKAINRQQFVDEYVSKVTKRMAPEDVYEQYKRDEGDDTPRQGDRVIQVLDKKMGEIDTAVIKASQGIKGALSHEQVLMKKLQTVDMFEQKLVDEINQINTYLGDVRYGTHTRDRRAALEAEKSSLESALKQTQSLRSSIHMQKGPTTQTVNDQSLGQVDPQESQTNEAWSFEKSFPNFRVM